MQSDVKHEIAYRRALKAVLKRSCHPKQRALVDDSNDLVATLAGRRGGKSHGWAVKVLLTCVDNPGEMAVCVALSEGKAVQIFWSAFQRIGKALGIDLKLRKVNGQASVMTPWGNRIWLAGCGDKGQVEKLRGDRYCCAVIDEADSLRHLLQEAVEDALGPALADLGGWLGLSGTPGAVPEGYFFRVTTGDMVDWVTHTWDVRDNPHMPDPELIFEKARRRMPEATFLREWKGQWVRDDEALIYAFDAQRNGCRIAELEKGMRTVIGIDLGYVDACAWAVIQYVPGQPNRYLVHTESQTGLAPSRAAALTERLKRQYPGCRLVADVGGLGKGYAVEWATRYGIHVETAQKQNKAGFISMMAGDLRAGTLKIDPYECSSLLQEWELLQWNEDRTGHDDRCQNHNSDAALYAWRAAGGQNRLEVVDSRTPDQVEIETELAKIDRAQRYGKRY